MRRERTKRAAGWGGGSGRPSRSLAARGAALLLTSAFLVPGCSSNPATGKKQLNFYSQAQEIELGRNADQQISAQLGVLDDARLQGWVADIGQRLAAKSERPDLPWSFKVIDDPIVNAFALPGGFIYVTRGLLGHLRNEAELASVLGHEIGHVTAQHGVNQMSKAQLAQGGLVLGAIFAPGLATDLASTGLGLLFLKYGRDDERQADDLGLRYMAGSGFDPREMPGVFDVLRRVGELQGAGRIPGWLSSHPDPGARAERASQRLAERDYPNGEVGQERYLRNTDGLVFGANPRLGYFDGRRFYHPEMGFSMEIPAGWAAANEASRVVGLHPEKFAQVDLRLAPGSSPEEAARAFLGQQGLSAGDTRSTRVNGLSAVEASFSVPRQGGSAIVGQANFVRHGERIFQLTALAVEDRVGRVRGELSGFLSSFAPLGGSQRDVQPQRLRVVRLDSPMTFEEFLRRHPSDERREVLELINDVEDPNRTLPAGTLLKRVEGRAVGTQKIEPGRS